MTAISPAEYQQALNRVTPEIQSKIDDCLTSRGGKNIALFSQRYKELGALFGDEIASALVWGTTTPTPKANPKPPARNKKNLGTFKSRRLRIYPDYCIDENGHVTGPAGTELKYRWNSGKPYVRLAGKDRSVYWLLVEAGFEEHPTDKRERRKPKDGPAKYLKCYNDETEAIAEDPELFRTVEGDNNT